MKMWHQFILAIILLILLAGGRPVFAAEGPIRDAMAAITADSFAPEPTAPAPSHRDLHIPLATYLVAAGSDVASSMFALGRYPEQLTEGNRVMAPLAKQPVVFGAVMFAVPAAVYLVANQHHGHSGIWERRLLKWGLYAGAAWHGWAAKRNVDLVRRTADGWQGSF